MRPALAERASIRYGESKNVMESLNHEARTTLIALTDLPDGGCTEIEAQIDGEMESLIVHRNGEIVRAWLNICPHAGRRLDWAAGKFLISTAGHLVCAAHGASFSLQDGVCVAGPCRGEALRAVEVDVRDGGVYSLS